MGDLSGALQSCVLGGAAGTPLGTRRGPPGAHLGRLGCRSEVLAQPRSPRRIAPQGGVPCCPAWRGLRSAQRHTHRLFAGAFGPKRRPRPAQPLKELDIYQFEISLAKKKKKKGERH